MRDDLPIPRAPHNNALFAGKPFANCSVFLSNVSLAFFMPCKSSKLKVLKSGTGSNLSGITPHK